MSLSDKGRWMVIGSLSYALGRIIGVRLQEIGYQDFEIADIIVEKLDHILTEYYKEAPLDEDDVKQLAKVMKKTADVTKEGGLDTTLW